MASLLDRFHTARRRWRRMDRLVRMMIANWLAGMALGVVCAIAALALDIADLRSLLWRSDMPVVGTALLVIGFALTFGGLYCAAAIMMVNDDDDCGPPRGGRKLRVEARPALALVTVNARPGR